MHIQFTTAHTAVAILFAASLSACAGGTSPPQASIARHVLQGRESVSSDAVNAQPSSIPKGCALIDTVNPHSDFAGRGFTARRFSGGEHLDVDASGCTYGIYLFPGANNLHIDHANVNGASRVQIFVEDVSGVTIAHTVVNGKSFDSALTGPGSSSLGGIAFRGANGEVEDTHIFNADSFGMNIVANNACFGVGFSPCRQSNVTVEQTKIDNSKTNGDGFVVGGGPFPAVTSASISHSTVIGANLANPPGASQFEINGAQVGYAFDDGSVKAHHDTSINNQIGFDVYCSTTRIDSVEDLRDLHDRVSYETVAALPRPPPLAENQILNLFSASLLNAAFPGIC